MSKRIKSGNFEKGNYFKIDTVQSKIDKETFSANKTLEKNGSSNDRLSIRIREQTESTYGEGGESRYGKATKNIQYVRVSQTQISFRTIRTFQKRKLKNTAAKELRLEIF